MASRKSLRENLDFASNLGLQYMHSDEQMLAEVKENPSKAILEMNYAPEPFLVYTLKMKYLIHGIDWRRETLWKNVRLVASDGFSLLFHGTLLRSASQYFSRVQLSTPDSPEETIKLSMFTRDGLLVLYDLVYKGYALIPLSMVIDILVQLSEIDPSLIKYESSISSEIVPFHQPCQSDYFDSSSTEIMGSDAIEVPKEVKKKLSKKKWLIKREIARLRKCYAAIKGKTPKKVKTPMQWVVSTIDPSERLYPPESPLISPLESARLAICDSGSSQPNTSSPKRPLPRSPMNSQLLSPLTHRPASPRSLFPFEPLPESSCRDLIVCIPDLNVTEFSSPSRSLPLAICGPEEPLEQQPSDAPSKDDSIITIDLLTPTNSPNPSPVPSPPASPIKTIVLVPEDSSNDFCIDISSPSSPESLSSSSSLPRFTVEGSHIQTRPESSASTMLSNPDEPGPSSPPPIIPPNQRRKRARMSTAKGGYLQAMSVCNLKLALEARLRRNS